MRMPLTTSTQFRQPQDVAVIYRWASLLSTPPVTLREGSPGTCRNVWPHYVSLFRLPGIYDFDSRFIPPRRVPPASLRAVVSCSVCRWQQQRGLSLHLRRHPHRPTQTRILPRDHLHRARAPPPAEATVHHREATAPATPIRTRTRRNAFCYLYIVR